MQEMHHEVEEQYAEWEEEKEQYMQQMRILHQQMRLKELVIDLFVPIEEVQKVTQNARWNDEAEQWILAREPQAKKKSVQTSKRPVSAFGLRRPTSDFTKTATAMGDLNPRFRPDNILCLDLDLPERTTLPEFNPNVAPADVQEALNLAFADEGGQVLFLPDEACQHIPVGEMAAQKRPESASRPASTRRRPSSARKRS